MEIFRLEKVIENEKLDLEMAMVQLKEAKENLSQSLKRRKELARQMNDHQYVEEKIEYLLPSSSSDEANKAIKELLEKNGSLQEEVRKLKREQEIQSIRLCEVLEQRIKHKKNWKSEVMKFIINLISMKISWINSPMQMKKSGFSKHRMKEQRNELNTKRQINESLHNDLRTERKINESLENDLISKKESQ